MTRKHFFVFFGLLLLLNDANAATTIDDGAFGSIWEALVAWMQGSLGYTIALLGTFGTLIAYMLHISPAGFKTNDNFFLFVGILISFVVGGCVGMVETMAGLGQAAFG